MTLLSPICALKSPSLIYPQNTFGDFGDKAPIIELNPVPKISDFWGKPPKNPQNLYHPQPRKIPKIILGNFGDFSPKNPKIKPFPVPKKSPIGFQTLSPSPLRPRKIGAGTGKTRDWGPVLPHYLGVKKLLNDQRTINFTLILYSNAQNET